MAVDADKLPAGVTKEQVVAVITKARTLLEAGDAGIALGTISKLYQAIHDARDDKPGDDKPGDHGDGRDDHGQVTPDKIKARIQAGIDALQAAVDADKLPAGANKEYVLAVIARAKTALEAGDIGTALGVLNKLHQAIHDAREDQPGDDRDDEEDDRDDDRDDDVRPEPPLPPVVEPAVEPAVQRERSGRGDRR